ncbi:MAG: twin-arginine translocase subunit TatB [Methylomonas sp.]|nr:twin-arginine translocase subunit TatB [Methylomonas sp.]
MFEVGFSELLLTGLVGLLVVGPERLPRVAREAALWLRKLRSLLADTQADIKRELALDDLKALEQVRELSSVRLDPMASLREAVKLGESSPPPSATDSTPPSDNTQR